MSILFSANITKDHQEKLMAAFPNEQFSFHRNMKGAKQHLQDAKVLVTYGIDFNSELLERAIHLKWIMVLSAGIEKLPLQAIKRRGIIVTNSQGIHKIPMSEYVISMLLQVYRHEKKIIKNETNKKWDRSYNHITGEITGKTMLVVGTGSIGQEVARLSKAFDMTTLGISRSGRKVDFFDENYKIEDLNNVLPQADFIVSVLPSTEETSGLFTIEQFIKMPSHAIFLNIGRGDVVVEADLLKAVQTEEIAHAILDVFETEPLLEDHPFWGEENITITPHSSGVSSMYQTRALDLFKSNLTTFIRSENDYLNEMDLTKSY